MASRAVALQDRKRDFRASQVTLQPSSRGRSGLCQDTLLTSGEGVDIALPLMACVSEIPSLGTFPACSAGWPLSVIRRASDEEKDD